MSLSTLLYRLLVLFALFVIVCTQVHQSLIMDRAYAGCSTDTECEALHPGVVP